MPNENMMPRGHGVYFFTFTSSMSKKRSKQPKKQVPEVGFEPTRTKRPAELESAPLDHSGIQAPGQAYAATALRVLLNIYYAMAGIYALIRRFLWPNWIRRLTTNQKIRGSSPLRNVFWGSPLRRSSNRVPILFPLFGPIV